MLPFQPTANPMLFRSLIVPASATGESQLLGRGGGEGRGAAGGKKEKKLKFRSPIDLSSSFLVPGDLLLLFRDARSSNTDRRRSNNTDRRVCSFYLYPAEATGSKIKIVDVTILY